MKRVAAMTVIRGEGECVALMNNVVMEEMARMNKKLSAMNAELTTVKSKRNEKNARELNDIRARLNAKPSLWARFVEKIEIAWCVLFATLVELGTIKHVGDGKKGI